MMDAATLRQNQAAEPKASTWLSANAGSGKTRVLTDRVARLLLDKVKPQNILCLTYTKAAASEMQNRLFKRLGDWAMKSDEELTNELSKLSVPDLSPDRLAEARRLFARAIETPGGLRIQTIHSFCASLLRRFPLEAGVTPNFSEMDDRAAALLREDIVDAMASGPDVAVVDAMARVYSGDDLASLTAGLVGKREALSQQVTRDDILGWFNLPAGYDLDETLEEAFDGSEADIFAALLPALRESGKATDVKAANRLAPHDWAKPDVKALETLFGVLLFGGSAKEPFGAKVGTFPTKDCRAALGSDCDALNDLMLRVEAVRDRLFSIYSAQKTATLYEFAQRFLPAYEAQKQLRGWLDFDDLIQKTGQLLADEKVSAWVLFRLDGGLDHILVDEAQDTSPAQWQVIERLAQEFTSGHGARDDILRTIFVVGDKKQSIYSFQGADPREFDRMKQHFVDRLHQIEQPLISSELEYSFRSSDAILRFVDRAVAISDMRHRAFKDMLPGRVDLWPAVPKTEAPERQNWYDPIDITTQDHHSVILARELALYIQRLIRTETIPAENGQRRKVTAGDFLILVRRRSDLFQEIIRACKALDLPVAGADRLKLGAELAVKDLAALLAFLATPEDSLSLAAALKSPLFGWDEAQLYDLAAGRAEVYLWTTLRNRAEEFPETFAMLTDLRDNADFLRPYDLIERILTRHDGRRKLLGRLGPEAEDGIDSLLSQSLNYERSDVPSLTGFLTWLETDDIEVKRQMDNAGDLIRVMTVHGAKGLESPIVILPDTAKRAQPIRDEVIPLEGGQLVWKASADQQPEVMKSALMQLKAAQAEEDERLFYVAATRAENWLIFAAAGDVGDGDDSWHSKAEAALGDVGAVRLDTPVGQGFRFSHADWNAGEIKEIDDQATAAIKLPDWIEARVPVAERAIGPRSPSDLGGAKALPGEGALDEDAALRFGRIVHRLLELLPGVARKNWRDYAERLLASGEDIATGQAFERAFDEARGVLDASDLGHLFVADVLSEVDISASLPELGGDRVAGIIDKLIVGSDTVQAVDFKTNVIVPDAPESVPDGVLRQMGAYQSALEQVFPDHRIEVAILWTKTQSLMVLPHEIVRQALQATATS